MHEIIGLSLKKGWLVGSYNFGRGTMLVLDVRAVVENYTVGKAFWPLPIPAVRPAFRVSNPEAIGLRANPCLNRKYRRGSLIRVLVRSIGVAARVNVDLFGLHQFHVAATLQFNCEHSSSPFVFFCLLLLAKNQTYESVNTT